MKGVSVVRQKGGTGKTMLSLAAACAAVADGLSTVVVDLDPTPACQLGDRRSSETLQIDGPGAAVSDGSRSEVA